MKKTALAILTALLTVASARAEGRVRIGEDVVQRYESPHPYTTLLTAKKGLVWTDVISYPGAAYIAPHFSRFHLAEKDFVVVRSPDGSRSWTYAGLGNADLGESADGFWGIDIPGDTAVVELHSSGDKGDFGYAIDRFARGYRLEEMGSAEQICGTDDSNWAKCYQVSEPRIYDRARAVARLLIQGSFLCTGWLVGNTGHFMTNNHCISTATEANNTSYEFMAEGATCATNCPQLSCPGTVVAVSATFIQTSNFMDFTLLRLPTNPTCTYGYVPLRSTTAVGNERMYIPNHSAGKGKRISVLSTDAADQSGFCEVEGVGESINCAGFPGLDVTYHADTEGGSSGSPVVAYSDHKAIALHHCSLGSPCGSSGGQITEIVDLLGANLPPGAFIDRIGSVKLEAAAYGCSATVRVIVDDDTRIGAGTQAVTVVSTSEPAGETLNLIETPSNSGHFEGTLTTTTAAPSPGNGAITVNHGETITARYTDADGGLPGCGSALRSATAGVDCLGPVISNVQVVDVQGGFADVSWTTNEPSSSVVTYGRADSPPPSQVVSNGAHVTFHGMRLTGLESCSQYVFRIASADPYGNATSADNGGANYPFTTLYEVSPTLAYTGPAIPIPDNDVAGAVATVQVPDPGTVLGVKAKVNVTHSRDGDVILYLIAPDSTQVVLAALQGGAGANFVNTTFDDAAATSIAAGSPPFTGSFRPEQPLAALVGRPAGGTWTLRAVDLSSGNTGSVVGFEVEIVYPSRPCYTEASSDTPSLVQDLCTVGGPGSGNAVFDAGEELVLGVTLRNSGTLPLSGISATLAPLTAGVVVTDGSASYPDLAPGVAAVSHAPHFRATLPSSLACGATVDFDVSITTDQGGFADTVQLQTGLNVNPIPLLESFDSGIPPSWTVIDGGTGGGPASTWTTANPGGRTFVAPLSDPVAIVDSDLAGDGTLQDEQLITPVLDLSASASVTLEFDQYFRWYELDGDEKGDVDVRSSLTGGTWVNVFRNQGASSAEPDHRVINITSQAAGASNVQIRFRYHDGAYEWYWEVDNVKVSVPGGCSMATCNSSAFPPEVISLAWTGKTAVQWTSAAGASGYNLYRGTRADLPLLLNGTVDSCTRGATPGLTQSGLSENPSAGSLTWWLVRGQNGSGEGPPGFARVSHALALRVQNSSGVCP